MPTAIKAIVQGAYDQQAIRIQSGNRICQHYYQARGVNPGEKPSEEMSAADQKILKRILDEYKLLAEGLTKLDPEKAFPSTEFLPDFSTTLLIQQYLAFKQAEDLAFKKIETALIGIPIYEQFLRSVTGCGTAMSGVLIATLDVHKATYPSQFWAAAGLDVGPDGRGRSRRKEHLVTRKYINKDGKEAERVGITFNPFLKSKLVYVLAGCLMKARNPYYKGVYDNYRHRLEHHVDWKQTTPLHRHHAARRYMIKVFLANLHTKWRELEGLPVPPPYHVAKLGMPLHHHSARKPDQGPQDIAAE